MASALGMFALGISTAMAAFGAAVSIVGKLFLDALLVALPISRITYAAIFMTPGAVAVLMALKTFGFLGSLKLVPGLDAVSQTLSGRVARRGEARGRYFSSAPSTAAA